MFHRRRRHSTDARTGSSSTVSPVASSRSTFAEYPTTTAAATSISNSFSSPTSQHDKNETSNSTMSTLSSMLSSPMRRSSSSSNKSPRKSRRRLSNRIMAQLVAQEMESLLLDDDLQQDLSSRHSNSSTRRTSRLSQSISNLSSSSSPRQSSEASSRLTHRRRSSAPSLRFGRRRSSLTGERNSHDNQEDENIIPDHLLLEQQSSTTEHKSGVIYGKAYSTSAVRACLFHVARLFLLLLMIRMFVTLLTMAFGMGLAVVGAALVAWFGRRPRKNGSRLLGVTHRAPVVVWTCVGATAGACHTMITASREEMVVLWGLFTGALYGFEVGALWLVVLGDSKDPTSFLQWAASRYQRWWDYWLCPSDAKSCCICLEPCLQETNRQVLSCWHAFHPRCLEKWLEEKADCPICRAPVDKCQILRCQVASSMNS